MNKSILNFLNEPLNYLIESTQVNLGRLPLKYTPWLKIRSNNKFSIVSAVYGVEKYLDDFFFSITNQTLIFEEHIELIMVDDGSLDGSAEIIEKWVRKYPDNIQYIKKENGGQASARNLGMKYVTNDWVTFIDPDDFIDKKYFESVDRLLGSTNDLAMISCNLIFFYEALNRFRDIHSLNYRFVDNSVSYFTIPDLGNNIQLSASSAFFRTQIIKSNKLEMSTHIKPTFEDAYFVNEYLLLCKNCKVAFLAEAKYFYRKRKRRSSTIDTSWGKKEQYLSKLENGYLGLLLSVEKKEGVIPDFIQRTVLYDLSWYFRSLVNHKENLSFLSKSEKDLFVSLLSKIFNKIDKEIVTEFELASCDSYYKTGWLHQFKNSKLPQYEIRVDDYDEGKNQLKLSYYFNGTSPTELITQGNKNLSIVYSKIREHDFMGKCFVLEKIMWIQLDNSSSQLFVSIDECDPTLVMGDQKYKDKISITEIRQFFKSSVKSEKEYSFGLRFLRVLARLSALLPSYQNAWVFMDRDVQADDNAEHLYRYIQNKKTGINTRFILRKTSHDWGRLKEEGFRLIPFGSIRHMILMFNAKHLISSHADNYVVNYPPRSWFSGIIDYKYTFLQHGVIKDDLSNWLNDKAIDVFVTASEREHKSIAGKQNRYKYTAKEVCLTGLARHDELLRKSKALLDGKTNKKTLLIMPTWRQNLVGKTHWMSHNRSINNSFYTSEYATSWKSLLHSKMLQKLINDHDLDVVFFPHANISPYINWFDLPEYITQVTHHSGQSIQDLFVSASFMLTDYSSVAFEVAYLKKPVVYYQFDHQDVFSGTHTTAKGYFDYTDDGFGPVCENEKNVLISIERILGNNCDLEKKYLDRVNKTFKYRDGKCCERIYESILDLGN